MPIKKADCPNSQVGPFMNAISNTQHSFMSSLRHIVNHVYKPLTVAINIISKPREPILLKVNTINFLLLNSYPSFKPLRQPISETSSNFEDENVTYS